MTSIPNESRVKGVDAILHTLYFYLIRLLDSGLHGSGCFLTEERRREKGKPKFVIVFYCKPVDTQGGPCFGTVLPSEMGQIRYI